MSEKIKTHKDLRVWQEAMDMALEVFALSKRFPKDELYSLTDQIRRSSRSVPANIAEAWRKRRYPAAFVAKLNDAEGEASRPRRISRSLCVAATLNPRPSPHSTPATKSSSPN